MNIETFWQQVAVRLDTGTPVFISLVATNTHGSPGTQGARLLVDATGDIAGTIGGGIMEAQLVKDAHRRLQNAPDYSPELRLLVHRKGGTVHPSGLICAGEQTNINLLLDPKQHSPAIRRFSDAISIGNPLTLSIDNNGLQVEPQHAAVQPGITLTETDDHWYYRETSINPKRMAIIGGGHCGKALANLAVQIGYHVDVFDTRDTVLQSDDWPAGARRHTLNDYSALCEHLPYPALTTAVVMTAAVVQDISALAAIAHLPLHWLGVMGSAAKIHEIHEQLAQRGIPAEAMKAIHGPIGLPMKSDKPPEIAVSIMAQLLADQADPLRGGPRKRDKRRAPS